jgi:quercetin 2,3-dioxygenase
MSIEFMPATKQVPGDFNDGGILELRPVIPPPPSFGHNKPGGFQPYSNLFYWANAWSELGSTIGLHPHKGFEILSYVVSGSVDHYDSMLRKWIPLKEGSLQIIRSGSGISHSEKVNARSRMFQIWLDPNLKKTLSEKASYDDYAKEKFPVISKDGLHRTVVIGKGSPVTLRSEVNMEHLRMDAGKHTIEIPAGKVLSWFQMKGLTKMGPQTLDENDFARIHDQKSLEINCETAGEAFLILSPVELSYETYF